MSKSIPYNHFDYSKKEEILLLQNHELLNLYQDIIEHRMKLELSPTGRVPQKLIKELEWVRDELLNRMK